MLGAGSASAARDGGVGASGPSACDDDCSLLNEDEEFEEEGEEYDDEQDLRPRALPVDGEPDFDSGPPADGLEYLRRVRWEAERCPSVMRADIDPRQFDSKRTSYAPRVADFEPAPPGTKASVAWARQFQPQFAALRAALRRALAEETAAWSTADAPLQLPPVRDGVAWRKFCLGSDEQTEKQTRSGEAADGNEAEGSSPDKCAPAPVGVEAAGDGASGGHAPSLRILAALDEVETNTLLHHAISWLDCAPRLSRLHALWLFALQARVDQPLDADTGAALRHLCRGLCALRAALKAGDTGGCCGDSQAALPPLNVLLAVAGEFFGAARDL